LTSIAPDTTQLVELEAETRQAWSTYTDRLRALTGDAYELIESESWEELQTELRQIERRRDSLTLRPA
jgi:hypothetical protein